MITLRKLTLLLFPLTLFLNLKSQEVLIQNGHSSEITCVQFSPFKKLIATGDENGTIKIWDSKTYKIITTFCNPNSEPIRDLIFLGAGNILIERSFFSAFEDFIPPVTNMLDSVCIYDLSQMKLFAKILNSDNLYCETYDTARGKLMGINKYAVSGSMLFFTSSYIKFTKKGPSLWFTNKFVSKSDPDSLIQSVDHKFPGSKRITALKINEDKVYIGFFDGTLEIRDLKNLCLIEVYKDFDMPVANIVFSKNRFAYFTGNNDHNEGENYFIIRNSTTNQLIYKIQTDKKGYEGQINNLSISDDEKFLAISKGINKVDIYSLDSGKIFKNYGFYDKVNDVDFIPDQLVLLVGGKEFFFINIMNNVRSNDLNNEISSITSSFVLSCEFNEDKTLVINYPGNRFTQFIDPERLKMDEISMDIINAEETWKIETLFSMDENNPSVYQQYYNTPYGGPNWLYDSHSDNIFMLASSRNDPWGDPPRAIISYDVNKKSYDEKIILLKRRSGDYFSLEHFNPYTNQFILTDQTDSFFYIIDSTGKEIHKDKWLPVFNRFAFSPSYKYFAFKANDTLFKVVDTKTFKTIFEDKVPKFSFLFTFFHRSDKILFFEGSAMATFTLPDGKIVPLFNHEFIDAIAISNDDQKIILASNDLKEISLSNYPFNDISLSKQINEGELLSMFFHPQDKLFIAKTVDNSLWVYNAETLDPVCNIIADQGEGLCFTTTDHLYSVRKSSHDLIAFRKDEEVFTFDEFDLAFNRPDIILERMGLADSLTINIYRSAYQKRVKKYGLNASMFSDDWDRPSVTIINAGSLPYMVDSKYLSIEVKAVDHKYKLDRLNTSINSVPIAGVSGISLREMKTDSVARKIELCLSQGVNRIEVSCMNEKGVESYKETIDVTYIPKIPEIPDLYLITLSVANYKDQRYNLKYAVKDGRDINSLFMNDRNSAFSFTHDTSEWKRVYSDTLFNEHVTREKLPGVKEKLMNSKVDDIVIVYVSGHGLLSDSLDFYFATYDMDFEHPETRGISFDELESLLDGIPARKKLLLMDACHSGEVDKEEPAVTADSVRLAPGKKSGLKSYSYKGIDFIDEGRWMTLQSSFELMQELFANLSRGSGAVVISAAAGKGYALESPEWNNGVFTYSILNGLKNKTADANQDEMITISELKEYVSKEVERLTNGAQKPTSRRENLGWDWRVW